MAKRITGVGGQNAYHGTVKKTAKRLEKRREMIEDKALRKKNSMAAKKLGKKVVAQLKAKKIAENKK
jgi:hypothetical protein